jgi:hypothetical protein
MHVKQQSEQALRVSEQAQQLFESQYSEQLHMTQQATKKKAEGPTTSNSVLELRELYQRESTREKFKEPGVLYSDLCATIKDIVPLSLYDIDMVLDHLIKRQLIRFEIKRMGRESKKFVVVPEPRKFPEMVEELAKDWKAESDAFFQDQEFADLRDLAELLNTSPEKIEALITKSNVPSNLIFLHKAGALVWAEEKGRALLAEE